MHTIEPGAPRCSVILARSRGDDPHRARLRGSNSLRSGTLLVLVSGDLLRRRQQGAGNVLLAPSIRHLEAAGGSFDWALQGALWKNHCHNLQIVY